MEIENLQTIYNKIKMAAKWIENAKKLLKQRETELIVLREDNKLLKKEIEALKNDRNQNVDFYKNLEIEIDNILSLLPDSLFESNSEYRKENNQKVSPVIKSEQTPKLNTTNNVNSATITNNNSTTNISNNSNLNTNKINIADNNQNKTPSQAQNLDTSLIDTNESTFDFDLESEDENNIIDLPKGVL